MNNQYNFNESVLKFFQKNRAHSHPYLIVCDNQKEAEQLYDNLEFVFGSSIPLRLFPDWEILPYDVFSPHQDIISHRLELLNDLAHQAPFILIANIHTVLYQLCPKNYLYQEIFQIYENQNFPFGDFKDRLHKAQYRHVSVVQEHGEYAVRGSLIDVYPMGNDFPIRIEWMDDEIESIRRFDVQNQLTVEKLKKLNIFPSKEFPLNDASIGLFRQNFRQHFAGNPNLSMVYENISNGQMVQGIENYLPLFFENTATIFDYLNNNTVILQKPTISHTINQFWKEISIRYEQRRHDITNPILPPESLFISSEFWHQQISLLSLITPDQTIDKPNLPNLQISRNQSKSLQRLNDWIQHNPQNRTLIMASSLGRREVILDLCKTSDIYPKTFNTFDEFLMDDHKIGLIHGPFTDYIYFEDLLISCVTEHELFDETIVYQKKSKSSATDSVPDKLIKDLSELSIGMPVVHIDFGVGRYEGLHSFEDQGLINEFLMIRYAGDDKIYVPITNLQTISKYAGSSAASAPLHRLGSDTWAKEKKKTAEKIHDIAIEILETQALRHAQKGLSCQIDWSEYERFVSAFRFDETEDQRSAIQAIIQDLQAPQPMDRLICGDVGFGKTEVAMRAAFIMVQNHRQVCVLVPTTLLAKQHFETFQERFADFPIQVELLSRFRTKKESEQVLNHLQQGKVDILIGTHKLLQQNVDFKQLGLLIIDEEHRFGVKQKEHIKKFRHQADVLSLTATPIPRTLNMAMHGMRDISLITTPPAKRLAIKTFWHEKSPNLLREALLREILRGGQVYYLHNDIDTIEKTAQELSQLVPEAKIAFAHGQMHERRLEQIMADFYHQRFNVLVCTTIIETGIDIPTANTIIIERADQLGLAQLHQLRGRVGRSHHQAYAYLLSPPQNALQPDAIKRLEAIVSLENLGAGFTLAMHDMEIRGAGEFLGEDQSGNMHSVGFSLYMEMLEQSIKDIQSGKIPSFENLKAASCEMDIKFSCIIPEDYIGDVHQRLVIYKRISHAKNDTELHQLQIELIDRFGIFPEPVKNLFASTQLKNTCTEIGIVRVHLSAQQAMIEFNAQPKIEPIELIKLIQNTPSTYQLIQQQRLQIKINPELSGLDKIMNLKELIASLRKMD